MTSIDQALLPDDLAVALVLRHAERPPLADGDFGRTLTITAAGREQSRRLGAELGSRVRTFRTSPTLRCRETAELIREGAGAHVEIVADRLLGEPSVLIVDPPLAEQNWVRLGHNGVMEHLGTSDEPLPGMRSPVEAASQLAAHLLARLDEQCDTHGDAATGIHVSVTHDVVLATFVSRLLRLGRAVWPTWLAGAAIWREGPNVRLAFEDRVWTVPR